MVSWGCIFVALQDTKGRLSQAGRALQQGLNVTASQEDEQLSKERLVRKVWAVSHMNADICVIKACPWLMVSTSVGLREHVLVDYVRELQRPTALHDVLDA
jgi:hypothetical protein